jgi:hypothetical protein
MFAQLVVSALQYCHWYAYVEDVGDQDPGDADSAEPTVGLPLIDGDVIAVGGDDVPQLDLPFPHLAAGAAAAATRNTVAASAAVTATAEKRRRGTLEVMRPLSWGGGIGLVRARGSGRCMQSGGVPLRARAGGAARVLDRESASSEQSRP